MLKSQSGGVQISTQMNLLTNMEQSAALHQAVAKNAYQKVMALLEAGANVNAKYEDGSTLLHRAARINAFETLVVLLAHGADINAKTNPASGLSRWPAGYNRTPLHVAAGSESLEAVRVLLTHGADVTAKDHDGNTPLHSLVTVKKHLRGAGEKHAIVSAKIAELLIEHGADTSAKDRDGKRRCIMRRPKMIRRL